MEHLTSLGHRGIAISAVLKAGLRVPGDIAVVGYDDQQITRQARPSITTISLPCYDTGLASAQLLIGLLDGQGLSAQPNGIFS